MYGGYSPDYSAPAARSRPSAMSRSLSCTGHGGRNKHPPKTRSPTCSPPRMGHSGRSKHPPRTRSPAYSPPPSRRVGNYREHQDGLHSGEHPQPSRRSMNRSRSQSPPRYVSRRSNSRSRYKSPSSSNAQRERDSSRSRSPPRYGSRRSNSRRRSKSPSSSRDYSLRDRKPDVRIRDDDEALKSLYCKHCNVTLYDSDSMSSHLHGKSHLMQLRRLADDQVRKNTGGLGLNDVLVPTYDPNFWNRVKEPQRLKPDQEKFLDTKRLDKVLAKFDRSNYDYGMYNETELHCEPCDVWVRSRHEMQAHKEGENHKKKSAPVQRFSCELCLIQVPCQNTLDNHMRGKGHLKKAKELMEQRRQQGRGDNVDLDAGGYMTGPKAMAALSNDDFEELQKLRKENGILKKKVKDYNVNQKKIIQENYNLKKKLEELENSGNHVKMEEVKDDLNIPSTSCSPSSRSNLVKMKTDVKHEEYVEQDDSDVIVLNKLEKI